MRKSLWKGCLEYSLVADVSLFVLRLGHIISISWGAIAVIAALPPLIYIIYRIINYIYFN